MSGTSTFFQRKRRVKSEIYTPILTLSKTIVCEFESLMREQEKILSFRASVLPNTFWLMSPFRESIWYVEGFSVSYFGRIPTNTWTVCIHFSSIDPVEKFLQRVEKGLITCNQQLTLITETRQWTDCRASQKRD